MAMTHHEIEAYLEDFFNEDWWASDPKYPVEDWKYEVANNDTRMSYQSWLYNKYANEEEEEEWT